MKITKRTLRRIIREEKEKLEQEEPKKEELNEEEELEEMDDWGEGAHEYRRRRGPGGVEHRAGDVGGHYKDYEGPYGGDKGDRSKTHPGRRDYMGESRRKKKIRVTKRQLQRMVMEALKLRK